MAIPVRWSFILIAVVGFVASCSKPKPDVSANQASPPPSAPSATARSTADNFACTLLTKEELEAVQGEPFKETKASQQARAGLTISQCYFELPTTVNSVVLTVTQKGEKGPDPGQAWRDIFHPAESARKKEEREEKEKEPLKVDGIGDEAFWTGTRVSGALYVLKGNCYFRISIGGAGDQAQKIDKSKKLAESVLKRL